MALTPDDVVTKQFQHVRFKDGFDPDEVDDFLDEIVIEWRKALEENVELKAKLAAYESGAAAPAAAPVAEAPAPVVEAALHRALHAPHEHFQLRGNLGAVRRRQFRGGARCRRAQVGDKVRNGHVRLMADRRDHRDIRVVNRPRDHFLVKRP